MQQWNIKLSILFRHCCIFLLIVFYLFFPDLFFFWYVSSLLCIVWLTGILNNLSCGVKDVKLQFLAAVSNLFSYEN